MSGETTMFSLGIEFIKNLEKYSSFYNENAKNFIDLSIENKYFNNIFQDFYKKNNINNKEDFNSKDSKSNEFNFEDFFKDQFSNLDSNPLNFIFNLLNNLFSFIYSSPKFGLNRGFEKDLIDFVLKYQILIQDQNKLNEFITFLFFNILEEFIKSLTKLINQGQSINSIDEFISLFTKISDGIFIESLKTKEFTDLQSSYINSLLDYKQDQNKFIEKFCQIFNIPTRSEIDKIYKRNYIQDKQITSLKKILEKLNDNQTNNKEKTQYDQLKKEIKSSNQKVKNLEKELKNLKISLKV